MVCVTLLIVISETQKLPQLIVCPLFMVTDKNSKANKTVVFFIDLLIIFAKGTQSIKNRSET